MAAKAERCVAILLLGGAFNPIHNGHIETLVQIKQYMESKENYKILSAFCVISSDRYVFGKYKKKGKQKQIPTSQAMTFSHRRKMCDLSSINYPWIFSSDFECASAPMFGELIVHEKEYKKYFNKKNGNNISKKQLKNIKRINCMGADKIINAGIGIWTFVANLQNKNTMNVAIGRHGYMDKVQKIYNNDLENGKVDINKFILIDLNVPSISSTQIREPLVKLYKKIMLTEDIEDNEDEDEKKNNEDNKDNKDDQHVDELQIIFKNSTKDSLPGNVIKYLLNNLNDLWITNEYFEIKKQIKKKEKTNDTNTNNSKSWFSGFGWKKK